MNDGLTFVKKIANLATGRWVFPYIINDMPRLELYLDILRRKK